MIVSEQNLDCHQRVQICLADADQALHHLGYTGMKYLLYLSWVLLEWVFGKQLNAGVMMVFEK